MLTSEQYFRFKVWYWHRIECDEVTTDEIVEDEVILPCKSFVRKYDGKLEFLYNGDIVSYKILEKGARAYIKLKYLTPEEAENIISKLNIL
jgi:hypothetical protein